MKMSSKEANKLLKKLNEDYKALLQEEEMSRSYVASIHENAEECRPKYDYDETQKKLAELEEKIRKVKHAINLFNVSTKVDGFDITIDQILVMMPQLTKQKEKLYIMKGMMPKSRYKDKYGRVIDNTILDYQYANYEIDKAKKDYDIVCDLLTKAQIALDRANSNGKIEIDI